MHGLLNIFKLEHPITVSHLELNMWGETMSLSCGFCNFFLSPKESETKATAYVMATLWDVFKALFLLQETEYFTNKAMPVNNMHILPDARLQLKNT